MSEYHNSQTFTSIYIDLFKLNLHSSLLYIYFVTVTHYIRISIGDKNDNAPYFDRSLYEAEVNEDEDINHTVITVTAKDKDESSKLRYEITKGNIGGGAFAVNNETGAIYVAGPLDYELRKEVT